MRAIGGYFGLSLSQGKEFHQGALRLNTGRNALEYILSDKGYEKIYIPYYTCDVILEPIIKLGIQPVFYHIDKKLEPVFDLKRIRGKEAFLYVNYFGLKDDHVAYLAKRVSNLIVDNAQAFFSKPVSGVDTFYSPRKFFGVPDGAYLYSVGSEKIRLEQDVSFDRMAHLLKRIDKDAEEGFSDFQKNEESLKDAPLRAMSRVTQKMLESINYSESRRQRIKNYKFMEEALGNRNELRLPFNKNSVPMVYPFLTEDPSLRSHLIQNRIYTPLLWPNVQGWVDKQSVEYHLAKRTIHIPIDQRYNLDHMQSVVDTIKRFI